MLFTFEVNVRDSMSAWKRPDPTPLRDDFYESRTIVVEGKRIVVALFRGEAAATHELIHVFSAMNEVIVRVLEAEKPDGIILDLRELKYSWGDNMTETLCTAPLHRRDEGFPVAVITSDLNREGLVSLVAEDMLSNPASWLSDSEVEATALILSKLKPTKA